MTSSAVRPRRLVVAIVVACVVVTATLVILPMGTAHAARPAGSVLVVRNAGIHDALWLLSPVDGTPTAAGELPGRAGSVAVSPDGANVAYLPSNGKARVWIGYGPLGPRIVSLSARGVKRVHSLTWVDDHRLLVAGTARPSRGIYQDKLCMVNARTGRTASFRHLSGTEPYAVPALGKVAYVKLSVVRPATAANQYTATIRESLRIVRVSGGSGRTVLSEKYRMSAEHRFFARPQLSQDGKWLLTATTGSDVSVTYALRDNYGNPLLTLLTPAFDVQAGWDPSGRTAFAGMPFASGMEEASVWVCDPAAGTLARTASGLLPGLMVTDLGWSQGGELVAGAVSYGASPRTRHVLVIPDGLASATDLGTGRLPVWVP